MTNDKEKILEKVKEAYEDWKLNSRQGLVDVIKEANDAGITYQEIGEALGISKAGISQFMTRTASGNTTR